MTLNRRYIRNIKHNLSFYICVTILTALVIVMYIGFTGAYDGEGKYLIRSMKIQMLRRLSLSQQILYMINLSIILKRSTMYSLKSRHMLILI